MTVDIMMPALSPTMEVGTLAKWVVQKGDIVKPGDLLAEIETDKAIMEFEAVEEGQIFEILVEEGQKDIPVNTVIARITSDSKEIPVDNKKIQKQSKKSKVELNTSEIKEKMVTEILQTESSSSNKHRIFSTPLARRIAKDRGIDLNEITGSGPRGRITKFDVENFKSSNNALKSDTYDTGYAPDYDNSIPSIYLKRDHQYLEIDSMRKTIISRLTTAKQTIPHYYLRRDIRIDSLLSLRSQMNEGLSERNVKLSINDFIIKASAIALQEVPECNVIWGGDKILSFAASDIAVAVAINGGLITPVLLDLEKKNLIDISIEMKSLADRARKKQLKPHEYQGGSLSISSLGMMGIKSFDAVINPPHGSILAIGAANKQPFVKEDNSISTQTIISVTLSADHRMIDGAVGAKFLERFSYNLENPGVMLV